MKRTRPVFRRQFLQGAGGVSLGLPFLPSILSRQAYAAEPLPGFRPNLWWMTTDHGGAFESNFFPNKSMLNTPFNIPNGHAANWGALKATNQGGKNVLSPILQADATKLTDARVAKMNVLWGLDIPFYIAHNTGGHLGNFAANNGDGAEGKAVQSDPRPTLDHMLGWSKNFYTDMNGILQRHVSYGYGRQVTWAYSNPSAMSGGVQPHIIVLSAKNLFNRLISVNAPVNPNPVPNQPPVAQRPSIADRVKVSYDRLLKGDRRLSARDKVRLSDHLSQIDELERKINAAMSIGGGGGGGGGSGAKCSPVAPAEDTTLLVNQNNPTAYSKLASIYNDVVAASLACGTTRVLSFPTTAANQAVSFSGNWHQDVAHQWETANGQDQLRRSYQLIFEKFFVDLMVKLDSVESAPGRTVLDDTLMVWSQECGMRTHDSTSIPVVTAGSGFGSHNTGRFIDYRNGGGPNGSTNNDKFGLLYNQFLASVAQSMGMQRPEFERWGHRGIGVPYVSGMYRGHYVNTTSKYFQMASEKLPIFAT
ncbi:MAG: DUF1552 domain-containing protein [Deltaproteobacteria bacterium]|nr:DUF1552 domain-containing protein [Deltaproteobacteria bacterium]